MSKAEDLADRLIKEAQSGAPLNWRRARKKIHEAHDAANTEAERVLCLRMHKAIMDAVERQGIIEKRNLAHFRKARQQDYNLLLVKEAVIGRTHRNVPPAKMAAITRREVAAGRMSPNDGLHKLAVAGNAILTPPQREARKAGVGAWIVSWFK
jgi:hypothetical protein